MINVKAMTTQDLNAWLQSARKNQLDVLERMIAVELNNRKGIIMEKYTVECQINANDDRLVVNVEAENRQQAYNVAQDTVRNHAKDNPDVRGCIVVDIRE